MSLTKVTYSMISGIDLNVNDYGADPTGVTDSTTAIQNAIDAGLLSGQRVVGIGTYKTSATVIIKGNADFSQAIFNVDGAPTIALEVSTGDAATILYNAVVWLPKQINNLTKPSTGWVGQGIGVRAVNLQSAQIFVGDVVNFATGLQVTSFDHGNVYNNYYLGHLENNKVNLALTPGNAGAWVNENNFFGGRFSQYSSEGTNVSGVRHIVLSKAANVVNNNLFIKPSIEGNTVEYNVENGGSVNTILQGRWESTTPKVLYTYDNSNQAIENLIIGGYHAEQIQFTFTGVGGGSNNQVLGAKTNNYQTGSGAGIFKISNSGSSANSIFNFYEAGTLPETASSTEWSVQHSAQSLQGKRKADAYARLKLDYVNGTIAVGNGTGAPSSTSYATFTTVDGKTVTVIGGVIASVV